ncbi:MAG TPA: penicillin-binding protein activator LpoB [Gammaproteobacteria bacterium]|nr:penicillin-binding protein activator LpoB [Gammaproteobacteria bacterium]
MLIRKFKLAALAIFIILAVTACATQVQRVAVNKDIDLSGAWNDTDSRMVSEAMIKDMLDRPWFRNYARKHNRQPAVIVGRIRNLSDEHINVRTFVSDIERAMINSGQINFVASSNQRKEIRSERKDQDINASESTRKAMGQEMGADFMLKGSINTIVDMEGKTQLRYYQIDLNLISLANNRMVWLGQKKIKKLIKNSRLRF